MTLTNRAAYSLLALIVAVGAWLRLPGLGAQSLWYDEIYTWRQSRGSFVDVFVQTANDNYPPLQNLLTHFSISLFGDSEWALRLPSALLAIATIIAIYFLAARIAGKPAALIAALILTLSPNHIWYSQEARMYALLAFTATAFALVMHVRMMSATPRYSVLTWLAGVALLYSHPFGVLTWIGILTGVAAVRVVVPDYWRLSLRSLVLVQVLTALAFVPWAVVLAQRAALLNDRGFWIGKPTFEMVWRETVSLASGNYGMALLSAGTVLALVFAIVSAMRKQTASSYVAGLVFLLAWLLIPSALAIAASWVSQPFFIARYAIGSLPAFICLAALGFAPLLRHPAAVAVVAAASVAMSASALAFDMRGPRPPWREIGQQIVASDLREGDCLVIDPDWQWPSLTYYVRELPACRAVEAADGSFPNLTPDISRVFLVLTTRDRSMRERLFATLPGWEVVDFEAGPSLALATLTRSTP